MKNQAQGQCLPGCFSAHPTSCLPQQQRLHPAPHGHRLESPEQPTTILGGAVRRPNGMAACRNTSHGVMHAVDELRYK